MRTQHEVESGDEVDDAEVEVAPRRRVAWWTRWRVISLAGLLVAGIGAGYLLSGKGFSRGPGEQEIQQMHQFYLGECQHRELRVVDSSQSLIARYKARASLSEEDKAFVARQEAFVRQYLEEDAKREEEILALERKYAKLWVQRGYKIRP